MVDTKKTNTEIAIEWLKQFDREQAVEIAVGLNNVDVSLYANPKFYWRQMEQIRIGMLHGIDVSFYLDPNIPWEEMKEIRERLEHDKKGDTK